MSGRTARFKLNRFGGGTSGTIGDDGQKYTSSDRDTIDRLLTQVEIHDHHYRPVTAALATAATAVLVQGGGALPSGHTYYYRYAVVDVQGIESLAAPAVAKPTPNLLAIPAMPSAYVNATDVGTLAPGTYYYSLTALRGAEETPLSAAITLSIIAGEGAVRVTLPPLGSADSFRVWRMGFNEAGFTKLGVVAAAEYLDNGSIAADPCACDPGNLPPQMNTGISNYAVTVTLPVGVDLSTARSWRLYRSVYAGMFPTNALVHEVVERATEWDPTSALLRSWTDVGDALVSGAPSDDDLNMRTQPFTLDSVDTAPATAGYPDKYPLLIGGVLHALVGGVWAPIGTSGTGGGSSTPTAVVGAAPIWHVDDMASYTGGVAGLKTFPSSSSGSALTVETVDVPAGRTKAMSVALGAAVTNWVDMFWTYSGTGAPGTASEAPLSVRFLYKFSGASLATAQAQNAASAAVLASLPETAGYQWSNWIPLGAIVKGGGYGPNLKLKIVRTVVGTVIFRLGGVEFMETAKVGTLTPTDGYRAAVPSRGLYSFSYADNVWTRERTDYFVSRAAYATQGEANLMMRPVAGSAYPLTLPPSWSYDAASADPNAALFILQDNLTIKPGRTDFTIGIEALVTGLTAGSMVRLRLRGTDEPYIEEHPHQDAVVPTGQTSVIARLEYRGRGKVDTAIYPTIEVFATGTPVVEDWGLTVKIDDYWDAYPLVHGTLPITGLAAAAGAAGTLNATWTAIMAGVGVGLTVYNVATGAYVDSATATGTSHAFTGLPAGKYRVTGAGYPGMEIAFTNAVTVS